VAIQASTELVIDATCEVILDVLADMDAVPVWSSVHRRAVVIDTHPDGRPFRVRVTIGILGIVDTQVLEYRWGPDWMVWDGKKTLQQHAQHGEYNLTRESDDRTRVRFTITVEPTVPMPRFIINRARKKILTAATEGLRRRVIALRESDPR
jgi:Polyketide cyclase / dehydrase and lipid transport